MEELYESETCTVGVDMAESLDTFVTVSVRVAPCRSVVIAKVGRCSEIVSSQLC